MSEDEIHCIWEDKYKAVAESTEVDYVPYMFVSIEKEIPWCAGYAVGYMLVQNYLELTKKSVVEILELKPEVMLKQLMKL